MRYKIEKGDKFKCLKDYVMDSDEVAYKKDVTYYSNHDNCITDEEPNNFHYMDDLPDFFEYFKLIID